jgi:hypothetical protein
METKPEPNAGVVEKAMDKDGWPHALLIPEEKDFMHGGWICLSNEADKIRNRSGYKAAKDHARDFECGTQCCLVGWIGVAFGGADYPISAHYLSKAHREFSRTFLEVAGEPYSGVEGLLWTLSGVFEAGRHGLSPRQARLWWIETAKRCGYNTGRLTRNW